MKAIVYNGPRELAIEDVDEPAIEDPTDVLVETALAGVCGSDLHIYHGDTAGVMPGETIGHELVGRVLEVGEQVTRVEPGDQVVASFQSPCGVCRACQKGVYNACQDLYIFGHGLAFGSIPGTQAERVRVPRADLTLRRIPDGLDPAEALLAGDVLTAAYTGVRPWLSPGDTVVAVGCGPVGLLALDVAAALGAAETYAIDLDADRLGFAAKRGHIPLGPGALDPVSHINDVTDGSGVDLVIEAVGGEGAALETAFSVAGPAGHVVALGVPTEYTFEYPWLETFARGGSFTATLANVPHWIDEVLALQAAGRLDTRDLVGERMPLAQGVEAYERFDRREALKILLEP